VPVSRLVYLPLDDRPVNYDDPACLGALADLQLDRPPREWLGNPWRPSRHAELIHWLETAASGADALLVAIDTLAYGGLIPSRTSAESAETILARLEVLKRLKAARPGLQILAYNVILRISRADSAEEEKEYWAVYGSRMFRLSYLEHKGNLGEATAAEEAERAGLRAEIPDTVVSDYLQGRARNHAVNRAVLDWLAEGVFDYLLLPQDDTADYGWNIAEARALQSLIRARGLVRRAITYPGADEIGSVLLARYACTQAGFEPRVWARYSSAAGPHAITAYEDRPVHELLKAHLAPLNGVVAETPEAADLALFINAPAEAQGAADLQALLEPELAATEINSPGAANEIYRLTRREMTTPRRSVEEFGRALAAALAGPVPVAVADVAFVNGADLALGRLLMREALAPRLAAYAAWNTAGNTLGTVLAHAVLRALTLGREASLARPVAPGQQAAHLAFLFRRFLDDYSYQALMRTKVAYEDLPALGLAPTQARLPEEWVEAVQGRVRARLLEAADQLSGVFRRAGAVREVKVANITLPWQRLFEIGFDVQVELP
jgi:hypothetical protein